MNDIHREVLRPISRRELLRGALLGGAGLFGASLLACGDDGDSSGSPTAGATATSPRQATLSAPNMTWQKLSPAGATPPARYDHSLVASGTNLYLFGGRGPEPLGDLWIYDIASNAWSLVDPQQPFDPPRARFGHNSIWDPQRSVMVLFGGQDGSTFYNDLWEYDPVANRWNVPMAGVDIVSQPSQRYGAAACLDDSGHMLITHGFTDTGRFDDTWQYDLTGQTFWTDVSPPANDRPLARCLVHGAWDIIKRRLLLFGGQSTETPFLDDLWGWSPEFGWQQIARAPHPTPRNMYALIYNAKGSSALLFGGRAQDGPQNDLWIFYSQGENWVQFVAQGDPPAPRYGHDMAIEPSIPPYLFGGTNGTSTFDDLWRLDTLPPP